MKLCIIDKKEAAAVE